MVLKAYENLYEATKNDIYFDYIKDFVDTMIDSTGAIKGYELESYNIDLINSGKLLLKFLTALVANFVAGLLNNNRNKPNSLQQHTLAKKTVPLKIYLRVLL